MPAPPGENALVVMLVVLDEEPTVPRPMLPVVLDRFDAEVEEPLISATFTLGRLLASTKSV